MLMTPTPGPGLTTQFIKTALEKEKLNKKIRAALIFLAQTMIIDMEYYDSLNKMQNRCYFWTDLLGIKEEGKKKKQ